MPTYMDRHETAGASQEEFAEALGRARKIAERYNIRLMTHWFDADRKTAFALMEAPDESTLIEFHNQLHGRSPNWVVEVDPNTVLAFLGRIEDPTPATEEGAGPVIDSAFRAIMFTDMVGSSDMTSRLGDEKAVIVVQEHNRIVQTVFEAYGGNVIKFTGDGFHASFSSVANSVKCAIEVQRSFKSYAVPIQDEPIQVTIGLSAGEPVAADKDLFGATVNLAARLCAHAKPEEILVAQVIKDLCLGKAYRFLDKGALTFKGFHEPVNVYGVDWQA
jgi:class 3 adenylate cyclase